MSGSLPTPQLASFELVPNSGTLTIQTPGTVQTGTLTLPGTGTVALVLSGTTGSIGGTGLSPGSVSTGTVAIAGVAVGMGVIATPSTYPGNNATWEGYVSSTGTVTVAVGVVNTGTPVASVYNIRVIP